jgi:hypothetical protein
VSLSRASPLCYPGMVGLVGRAEQEGSGECQLCCGLDLTAFSFLATRDESHLIHVKAGGDEEKFWLNPVVLASNYGFNNRELNEVMDLVEVHLDELLEAWHEHLG